jgi:hypothetical protein
MTDPLSPAAQAVLNAAEDAYDYNYSEFHRCADRVAAAALQAAAVYCTRERRILMTIAAELEGKA